MPTYIYTDADHHYLNIHHGMRDNPDVTCPMCGATMWRKPQLTRVNWGGLPPHAEHRSPEIQKWIDGEQQAREHFQETSDTNPFNEFSKTRSATNG